MVDNPLKLRGFQKAGLEPETGDILLSFTDQNGEEQWLQLPLHSAGLLAAGLLAATQKAAEGRGDAATDAVKTISSGMNLASCEVGISTDHSRGILVMRTQSGLTFDFPLTAEAISDIRIGLRKVAAALGQGKRRPNKKPH